MLGFGIGFCREESYRCTYGTIADSSKRSGQRPPHTEVVLGLLIGLLVVRIGVCIEESFVCTVVQNGRLYRVPKGTMLADSKTVGVVIVVVPIEDLEQ